jgi:hypothetical protein
VRKGQSTFVWKKLVIVCGRAMIHLLDSCFTTTTTTIQATGKSTFKDILRSGGSGSALK